MDKVFPDESDFIHVVEPPFSIEATRTWFAVAVGSRGLILRYRDNPQVLRWVGQVVKFNPQVHFMHPQTILRELVDRGLPKNVKWQAKEP